MGYNLLGILWELWDSCDGYTGISGDMIWDTGILQYMITVIMNNETYYMTFLLDIVGVFCILWDIVTLITSKHRDNSDGICCGIHV